MRQKLLKAMTLGLLFTVGAAGALADDYDGTSAVYSPTNGTNYTTLKDAITAFDALSSGSSFEVDIYKDVTVDARITCKDKKSLDIVPKADVTITRKLDRKAMWFLNNSTGTLSIGNSEHKITVNGGGLADNQRIFNAILKNEGTGKLNVTNVTFQDIKFDTENSSMGYLFLNKNANGIFTLNNVTVSNCITTEDAFIKNISTSNDNILLQGYLNFDGCTGTDISTVSRIRLGEKDGSNAISDFTASTPISINWAGSTTSIGTAVVVKAKTSELQYFTLTNADLGLFGNNNDLKLTQAYTLDVPAAGAATLVLPFESTIPEGTTAYTLTYAGGDKVTATEVTDKLYANTPVLVNASEGNYKWTSTATTGDVATGSDAQTVGALTGVYTSTTVPSGSYILYNGTSGIGFYKADGSTNTVDANHAYLTANGTTTAKSISIVYGGEATGINSVNGVEGIAENDNAVYNLQGVRMSGSLPKGLYIKNGKKFILK